MEYKITNNLLCVKSVKDGIAITDTFIISKIEHMCFYDSNNTLTIQTNRNKYTVDCDKEKYAELIAELDDKLDNYHTTSY